MDIKKCKVGTRVQFNGTIIHGLNDIVSVHVRSDDGEERYISTDILKPATPPYDPKRMFRKGDIAELDYKGRDQGFAIPEGTKIEVMEDEKLSSQKVKVKVDRSINSDGWMRVEVFYLVLIKPIEEIEKEEPYFVDTGSVKRRDGYCVTCFSYVTLGKDKADRQAQEVCDELNREYRKLLNR